MRQSWKPALLSLLLVSGCSSSPDNVTSFDNGGSVPTPSTVRASQFGVIDGELTAAEPSQTHLIQVDPAQFTLPNSQLLLKLTLEHERGKAVAMTSGAGVSALDDGLVLQVEAGASYQVKVTGSGDYRILVSLAGDLNGDYRVDQSDLTLMGSGAGLTPGTIEFKVADLNGDDQVNGLDEQIARANDGAATRVRPIDVRLGLEPGTETYSSLSETLNATGTFSGQVSPGSTLVVQRVATPGTSSRDGSDPIPVSVDASGAFTFQAPLTPGDNAFQATATDSFGQVTEGGTVVQRVDAPSEPPSRLDANLQNRIWLLDVHANNYLFRGPLPLTNLEDTGRVDFQNMLAVMNQRLQQQKAPMTALPTEFDYTEIVLFTNMATAHASHGDEGFALHQIYKTILGADPAWPPDDRAFPTSLFSRPLDNVPTPGATFTETVGNTTYTIHPSVVWQPLSANSTGQTPTTIPDGPSGYESVVKSTFPIVSIAPSSDDPIRKLTNPLSNLSHAVQTVQGLMQPDRSGGRPHIFYVHCINGHDRTGEVTTAYVLSTYGKNFNYDLPTAYKYGQMGQFLPDRVPDGVDPNRNFWDKIEEDKPNAGKLKPPFMQAVQALAFLYHPEGTEIQPEPVLPKTVPDLQLWQNGYSFGDPTALPTRDTPADYLHVRP